MRNFIALEEKSSVREFLVNDLSNAGLRIDTTKHRNFLINQPLIQNTNNSKQQQVQHTSRVFNIPLHQLDSITIKIDNFDLTVPIFLRWCFDCIRRSIKYEGLFRKSGGSQRVKELMVRFHISMMNSENSISISDSNRRWSSNAKSISIEYSLRYLFII